MSEDARSQATGSTPFAIQRCCHAGSGSVEAPLNARRFRQNRSNAALPYDSEEFSRRDGDQEFSPARSGDEDARS